MNEPSRGTLPSYQLVSKGTASKHATWDDIHIDEPLEHPGFQVDPGDPLQWSTPFAPRRAVFLSYTLSTPSRVGHSEATTEGAVPEPTRDSDVEDLRELRADIRGLAGDIRGEMGRMRGEFGEMKAELGGIRGEVRGSMSDTRADFHQAIADQHEAIARVHGGISGIHESISNLHGRLLLAAIGIIALILSGVGIAATVIIAMLSGGGMD